ncbi:MAG: hypothetical protein A2287_02355 [Candidatus Melainabacteria bacterium RIFOXYA12_FULL_32_12]|nr:MAG: hypothetical protein A2104_02045 [Candidatus Melainabacteria bacterium GWF2_32_7]OGI21462.1 MAG: hypothetical protein A2255_04345 [Candidatus Melainabacteria bacterium RIFOXYA2_FULL_32_9]OGI30927.1 MAG: hypothetical protein A2287_02355 [Candidatus Melainabacteria bacterium RIFOXYA12_FULL_32_12]
MLSDIKEQSEIIDKLVKKYLPIDLPVQGISLNISDEQIKNLNKIYIVASGSSRNVGNIAKYFLEEVLNLPVFVDYASEFAHRNPSLDKNDLVIAISQSGETADTYAALKIAIEKGSYTFALTNNPDSKIYNLAQSKMPVGAGKEKSIPATKSFTAQLLNLYILALYVAEKRNSISSDKIQELKAELCTLGKKIEKFLENTDQIDKAAEKIKDSKSLILLGRGTNSAVAEEGALKIKETSYIDANGYPAGEFLHGYVAVVDENIPVISIISPYQIDGENYNLVISNTEEVKRKRNPDLVIIKSQEDLLIENRLLFAGADFINIPQSSSEISPVFAVISLQLLSFRIAELLGRDVNNPRSLTKSITAE